MARSTKYANQRWYLESKGVRSYPLSTSQVIRRSIEEMCRTLNVSFVNVQADKGFLNETELRKARKSLRKKPNCRVRIVKAA